MATALQPDLDLLSAPESPAEPTVTEDLQAKIKSLVDQFHKEDQAVRFRQLRVWKKHELYWEGVQHVFLGDVASEWQTPRALADISSEYELDPEIFSKVINIVKAHGESIISALAAAIPTVRFFPDDADNPEDLTTAKVASSIAELVERHNDSPILLLRALYLLYNYGVVFAYTYHHQDKEYGITQQPQYSSKMETETSEYCPGCGQPVQSDLLTGQANCQNCGAVDPYVETHDRVVPIVTSIDNVPKGREKIEFFGPLNVTVPHYIRKQSETPYLRLDYEEHYTTLRSAYPEIADKINGSSAVERNDRWARSAIQYGGDVNTGLCGVSKIWFRPSTYTEYKETDTETYELLTSMFPDGFCVTLIDDEFVDIYPSVLDDNWTLYQSPTSAFIHALPLVAPLIPIQDGKNDLYNLKLQTVELGIPETFADPAVLNFQEYDKHRNEPGNVYPAKPRPGQKVQDAFFTVKTATMSRELDAFEETLQQDGQFVLGDFPSIYGGVLEGGSKTLGEYQASRNQALQRLSIPWKALNNMWATVVHKSVKSYINHAAGDEHYVNRDGENFTTVWIKQAELQGSIGQVEPEVSEQFPTTWAQKAQKVFDLIELNSDPINNILMHPENVNFIKETFGLPELHVPGTDDREYQLFEIEEMIKMPSIMGIQSSIPVADYENHMIHAAVCQDWLVSGVGRYYKQYKPEAFQNVLLHWREHMMALGPMAGDSGGETAPPSGTQGEGESKSPPPPSSDKPKVQPPAGAK